MTFRFSLQRSVFKRTKYTARSFKYKIIEKVVFLKGRDMKEAISFQKVLYPEWEVSMLWPIK